MNLLIALFCGFISFAQAQEAVVEPVKKDKSTWEKVKEGTAKTFEYTKEKVHEAGGAMAATRTNRAATKWTFSGHYSFFETWVLTKYGMTVAYNRSPSSTYEFEFAKGSVGFGVFGLDIAKLEEQRLALRWRTYCQRNTFNMNYGIYYNKLSARLGSELLDSVSGGPKTSVELLELSTVGVSWGLGHRWQTKGGFIWGADWLTIHMPVFVVKESTPYMDANVSQSDRNAADDTWRELKRFPEFAVIKAQLGFSF